VFRNLLVDNGLRYLFNPLLGAIGALTGWALFEWLLANVGGFFETWDLACFFALLGAGISFSTNLLKNIQDGAGAQRVMVGGAISLVVGGLGSFVAALLFTLVAGKLGMSGADFLPRLLCYLFVGFLVGLSSRVVPFDKVTLLGAVGGLIGGAVSVGLWVALEGMGDLANYSGVLVSLTFGGAIGLTTYSLPSFVEGGTLKVMSGQFKGQKKVIEDKDIIIGNNKRQLQWVLPKWEGIQDPHAKLEVKAEGRGYKHSLKNMCKKTVVVVRAGKKTKVAKGASMPLEHEDTLVFATGRDHVKVKYLQKQVKE